jgi:hypothetical protein
MRYAVEEFRRQLEHSLPLDSSAIETFVGRAVHLSQIWPAVFPFLRGGYALALARTRPSAKSPHRRRIRRLVLRPDGLRRREFADLLDIVDLHVREGRHVALACSTQVAAADGRRRLISSTDVSGVDGVGGFAFSAALPGIATLVSEKWPPDIQEALDEAARPRSERTQGAPTLSLPAAELFGMWAVPLAVVTYHENPGLAEEVTAIGDCDPAVFALERSASPTAVMNGIIKETLHLSEAWLPVSVPREWNQDADRLSHPGRLLDVLASLPLAMRQRAVLAPIPRHAWDVLRTLIGRGQ